MTIFCQSYLAILSDKYNRRLDPQYGSVRIRVPSNGPHIPAGWIPSPDQGPAKWPTYTRRLDPQSGSVRIRVPSNGPHIPAGWIPSPDQGPVKWPTYTRRLEPQYPSGSLQMHHI